MGKHLKHNSLQDVLTENISLWIAIIGLILIVVGNAFSYKIVKIKLDELVANVGALFLIAGLLQWFFDNRARRGFFDEIKESITGSKSVADSGIVRYYADSKMVDLSDQFLTSDRLIIGVNYSAKLIDSQISSLHNRAKSGKGMHILIVRHNSIAGEFLRADYNNPDIAAGLNKIRGIVDSFDKDHLVKIDEINTILRYSFIIFDRCAWIIMGTNAPGRRAVPGFLIQDRSPWFEHFENDVTLLIEKCVCNDR